MGSTPPLIVKNFLSPCAARKLTRDYGEAVAAGVLQPNGRNTTDMPLRLVAERLNPELKCGESLLRLRELRAQVIAVLGPAFGIGGLLPDYSAYTQVKAGGSHVLHADAEKPDGTPNHCPHRAATAILYLNAAGRDFHGGELLLPAFDLSIVPEPGLLVGFPCTWTYRHEVLKVTQGTRDAILFWTTTDPKKAEYWPASGGPSPARARR